MFPYSQPENKFEVSEPSREEFEELQRKLDELTTVYEALSRQVAKQNTDMAGKPMASNNSHDDTCGSNNQSNEANISMKLVAFLNAKHYMVFAGRKGQTHGHSWQFQADVDVRKQDDSFIKFDEVDKHLNLMIAPYQRMVLNDVPPFDKIEPLTENLAVYFFNVMYDDLAVRKVHLNSLTVWENPTKGIEIDQKTDQFFYSSDSNPVVNAKNIPLVPQEAAASKDTSDTPLLLPPPISIPEPDTRPVAAEPVQENSQETDVSSQTAAKSSGLSSFVSRFHQGKGPSQPDIMKPATYYTDKHYYWWQILLSVLLISGVGIWAYWPIINAMPGHFYPYGFDSWCHVLKTEFLIQQIQRGDYYPQLFAYWHNGVQPFRYWGPLSYYLIASFSFITKNVFLAINWYIVLCALLGGLGWLSFRTRIGIVKATLGGLIWVIWLDYIKEAFRVGNYPRLLTIALLPILTEYFLRTLERKRYLSSAIVVIVIVHLIVLSHAMIGAIYCVSLVLVGTVLWLTSIIDFKGLVRGTFALGFGVLTSLWWLLPSLVGAGATGTSNATTGGARFVPATQAFSFIADPASYMGVSLLVVMALVVLGWKKYPKWARSLFICGVILILLCFPQMKLIQSAIPLHYILWPLRFSSVWSLALILSVLSLPINWKGSVKKYRVALSILIVVVAFASLAYDSYHSLEVLGHNVSESMSYKFRSISSNAGPNDELTIENSMKSIYDVLAKTPGWKVATLDNSTLGSSPTYRITENSKKEQVFGWAWQGAQTENNVMLLNTALDYIYYPFLFDRLCYMGGTDLLVLNKSIKDKEQFEELAKKWGYKKGYGHSSITLWHGLDQPYMIDYRPQGLAIGKSASIYAIQFPDLEIGGRTSVDEYSLSELEKYRVIVLAGAQWRSRPKAEELIRQYTSHGGRVIVDLIGSPEDVMSRQPAFMGVYGEPITSKGNLHIVSAKDEKDLDSFASETWRSIAPQPLDEQIWTFKHYGNDAALLGVKIIGNGQFVYYIGANLAYHAFLTHDRVALNILEDTLQLPLEGSRDNIVKLDSYTVKDKSYYMSYHSGRALNAVIPIASLDGLSVAVDKKPVSHGTFENLLSLHLPAGNHQVVIIIKEAKIFKIGRYGTIAAVILVLIWVIVYQRRARNKVTTRII